VGKRPTQEQVARLAETSTAVVSYVVNNGPRPVAENTRKRVLEAIAATGYRPNSAARTLVSGRSSVIGLVVPDLANPFLALLAQSIEHELFSRAYSMLIGDSADEQRREASVVETLLTHEISGLIWYTVAQPPPQDVLDKLTIPTVILNDIEREDLSAADEAGRVVSVLADEREAARLATEHLVDHGRQRIAHVGGPSQRLNSAARARGWLDAVAASDLRPGGQIAAPFTRQGGFESAAQLVELECDAVVAANEMQGIGLLAGLRRAGVRVPEDLGVIALNGTTAADYSLPTLTTVEMLTADLAAEIADTLDSDSQALTIVPDVRMIARESCGCANIGFGTGR
jgi:LacI family transcriptional regulator